MAIVCLSGFETGSTLEPYALLSDAASTIQSATVRTGAYAFKCGTVGKYAEFACLNDNTGAWDVTTGIATTYTRFYFLYKTKPSSATGEDIYASLGVGAGGKAFLRLTSAGKLALYDRTATGEIQVGATVLSADTWYRIEVLTSTGNPSAYEVKIDGVSELAGNCNQSTTNTATWVFGSYASRNANAIEFYYDDICISNSAYPGRGQCQVMQPDSDGTYTTWAASTGSRWSCVDEIPIATADYVESTLTVGNACTVQLESASSAGIDGTILATSIILMVARPAANSGAIRMRLRSNATENDSAQDFIPGAATYLIRRVINYNPEGGGTAWTPAALDSVQVGAFERSATYNTRMYGVYLLVDFAPAVNATVNAPCMSATAALPVPALTVIIYDVGFPITMSATAQFHPPTVTGNHPVILTVPKRDLSFTIPPSP